MWQQEAFLISHDQDWEALIQFCEWFYDSSLTWALSAQQFAFSSWYGLQSWINNVSRNGLVPSMLWNQFQVFTRGQYIRMLPSSRRPAEEEWELIEVSGRKYVNRTINFYEPDEISEINDD